MEAIITVITCSIIGVIFGFNVYCLGGKYKRIGCDILRAIIGANVCYWMLVLMIGLAPMYR